MPTIRGLEEIMLKQRQAVPATMMPPMKASAESTAEQLRCAREQGQIYGDALQAMNEESGAQRQWAGEYEVAVVVEKAEGLWEMADGELQWHEPTSENAHVEVAVRDAADGRFIPGLDVVVDIETANGRPVGTHQQPFLWHPWIYHYGRNWQVPGEGDYRIRVQIAPPTFSRHDHKNGNRYARPVEATFTRHIKPGQKTS
jgi:Fe2+ transport protein